MKLKNLFMILSAVVQFSSCSAPAGDLPRFREVESGRLYRSGQPSEAGYAMLARNGIRTVLKLNSEKYNEEKVWASKFGIILIYIPISGIFGPEEEEEERIQSALNNQLFQPILVHCTQGEDRTGLAAALYRVNSQNWSAISAYQEWKELGHSPFLFGMDIYFKEHTK